MDPNQVWIVRTGTANTASVIAGIERSGKSACIVKDPQQAWNAEYLVLPGVGALAAAMQRLQEDDMVHVLQKRIRAGKPTMAICLGLQLLCQNSEESPNFPALGLVESVVEKYPSSVRVPQLGWNRTDPEPACRLLKPGYAYFANSYRIKDAPTGWSVAWADYAGRFVAAMEKGRVLACQFHPELSGPWGQALMQAWLEADTDKGASSC